MSDIESRLYGDSNADEPADAAPIQDAPQAVADRIYASPGQPAQRSDVPANIAELRATDPERRLYDPAKTLAAVLPEGSLGDVDAVEARHVAVDLGAEVGDLQQLRTLMAAQEAEPGAWAMESHRMIAQERITPSDLESARQLVARDPRVREFLDSTGLGDHPVIVKRFVELARSARVAGRLPVKGRR
jgi:hypothetical protein